MIEVRRSFKFPVVFRIVLRNFSLYSSQPVIAIDIPRGVFCLAGANGLGKSTFLSALNFGLTGIVSEPTRRFESVEEYYRHSLRFSSGFFEGRVSESDREVAEIEIEMTVGPRNYRLTRGMFEPEELRSLEITSMEQEPSNFSDDDSPSLLPRDLQQLYAEQIAKDIGLDTFEQFVFLQHFVFSFDERRHLIFWDDRVMEQVLYLAFAADRAEAVQADNLRREIEKAASRARNFNWQATEIRKRAEVVQSAIAVAAQVPDDAYALREQHRKLSEESDEVRMAVDLSESKNRDAYVKVAELSARHAALRAQYAEEFDRRLRGHPRVSHHPLVTASLAESSCALCKTATPAVPEAINQRIDSGECPLCGSPIEKYEGKGHDFEDLARIDGEIQTTKTDLDEALRLASRLTLEVERERDRLRSIEATLAEYEKANASVLTELQGPELSAAGMAPVLERYREQIDELLRRKEDEYRRRDNKQRDLNVLQKRLAKHYFTAQDEFVSTFRELAYLFLGLELDVGMETSSSSKTKLVLSIRDVARRQQHQLSESQRFFVDIALRMALARYMSHPEAKASLFIDTPEGSLDIAYESRAGEMFARFIEQGFSIIMTANINSSQLLIRLAERCGHESMKLERMTSWTELSAVQSREEALFDDAFANVERSLGSLELSQLP